MKSVTEISSSFLRETMANVAAQQNQNVDVASARLVPDNAYGHAAPPQSTAANVSNSTIDSAQARRALATTHTDLSALQPITAPASRWESTQAGSNDAGEAPRQPVRRGSLT